MKIEKEKLMNIIDLVWNDTNMDTDKMDVERHVIAWDSISYLPELFVMKVRDVAIVK